MTSIDSSRGNFNLDQWLVIRAGRGWAGFNQLITQDRELSRGLNPDSYLVGFTFTTVILMSGPIMIDCNGFRLSTSILTSLASRCQRESRLTFPFLMLPSILSNSRKEDDSRISGQAGRVLGRYSVNRIE